MTILSVRSIYIAYVAVFLAVISGIVPREVMLYTTALLALWMLFAPLESGIRFFVQSIPLFVALPLTESFDNLNMWRPLSVLLIVRYACEPSSRTFMTHEVKRFVQTPYIWLKDHPVILSCMLLLVCAALSLIGAPFRVTGAIRILYFINLSMVPVAIYGLLRQQRLTVEALVRSIATAVIVVLVVGVLQLISTYLIDVYQFMRLWGEEIQLRQFGTQWSYIAVSVGNTWLAYYGDQLSLRVFSLFPDSHSFPTFLLLGIPALLAISTRPIVRIATDVTWGRLIRTYAQWSILWVPLAFLCAILSGTRGIWAASIGVVVLVPLWLWFMRRLYVDVVRRRLFAYSASFLAVFFLLFSLAWPIFVSPQFLVGKGNSDMFSRRIRSVIDFGETSNSLRLAIWKASLISIYQRPLLGVGIGNFPIVLNQDISLARAGSTAHNMYVHVAAEMGIPAALIVIGLMIGTIQSAYRWFARAQGISIVYAGSLLLFLPWVYAYVMTDPILFDERVYLLWATTLALIWANDNVT